MTTERTHRQHFDVSPDTYWRELCLSLAYQERLYREALGCTRMEVLENSGSYEHGLTRRLRFTKPIDAPAPIAKLFGDAVTIEEHSGFDAVTQRWTYRMVPALFADRIDIRGVTYLAPSERGVEQISVSSVTCKLFGLGGIIEPFVARATEDGHRDRYVFTQKYIAEKQLR